MTDPTPPTTAERLRRARRDQEEYRRRHLARRAQAVLFRRYLYVIPHVFLLPGRAFAARLLVDRDEARARLRGEAIWTLDTATRLLYGKGLLVTRDLVGYLDRAGLDRAVDSGIVGAPSDRRLSVDPLYEREPLLIAHVSEAPPPFETLDSGERVVTREHLVRDIFGTLGFRPDLLARIEDASGGANR